MSRWTPLKRRTFVRRLRTLGFEGPYSGARHQFLIYQNHRLAIPSNAEYSVPQVRMMVKEVEEILERKISLQEWANLS